MVVRGAETGKRRREGRGNPAREKNEKKPFCFGISVFTGLGINLPASLRAGQLHVNARLGWPWWVGAGEVVSLIYGGSISDVR